MSDNSKSYLSFASLTCVLLIPLCIGLASSNIMEGGVRGIVAISVLFGLPFIFAKIKEEEYKKHGVFALVYYLASFFVTFVIVIIAMLVTNT